MRSASKTSRNESTIEGEGAVNDGFECTARNKLGKVGTCKSEIISISLRGVGTSK